MDGCMHALSPTQTWCLWGQGSDMFCTTSPLLLWWRTISSGWPMPPSSHSLPVVSMYTWGVQVKVYIHIHSVLKFVLWSFLLCLFSFSPCSPMPLSWYPFRTPSVPSLSPGLSPVSVCFPVCVEVPSETEAVQGNPMKLRCISCMKREEVEASTVVEWFYRPEGGKDFLVCLTADSGLFLFCWPLCCVPGSWESEGGWSDKQWLFLFKTLTATQQITDRLSLSHPLWKEGHLASCKHSWLQTEEGRESK